MQKKSRDEILAQAASLLHAEQPLKALELLEPAIAQSWGQDAGFLYMASGAFHKLGLYSLGAAVLEHLISSYPENNFYKFYANLGICYRQMGLNDKSRRSNTLAVEYYKENYPDWESDPKRKAELGRLCSNLSSTYVNEGCPEEGEKYAKLASEHDGSPITRWNLSLILLEQGKWRKGFDLYRAGLETGKRERRNYTPFGQTPLLEDLNDLKPGQRLVVYTEQGLGDELMFGTCLPEFFQFCRRRNVDHILECNSKLESLFQSAFPGVAVYGTRGKEYGTGTPPWAAKGTHPPIDWCIPIGNLPYFFRASDDDFTRAVACGYVPYLSIKGERIQQLKDSLSEGKPVVGLAWTGGLLKTHALYRSIRLEMLAPVLELDARFVSLQYDDNHDEIEWVNKHYGSDILEFPERAHFETKDYYPYAELVEACDVVVTVCQSLAHLCGVMGKPCIVICPDKPAWRYCPAHQKYQVWYRDNLILRKQPGESWAPVIREVVKEVRRVIG